MEMKGSFRESGSDEVMEELIGVCFYSALLSLSIALLVLCASKILTDLNNREELKDEIVKERKKSTAAETLAASLKKELTDMERKIMRSQNKKEELKDVIAIERKKSTAAETLAANLKKELTDMKREEMKSQNKREELKDVIAIERKKSTAAETLAANLKKELTDMKREEMKSQNKREELKDVIAIERKKSTAAETLAANLKKELTDMKREEMKSQNKREELKDVIAKERKKSTAAETLAANLKKELTDMKREEMKSQNKRDLEQYNIWNHKDKALVAAINFGTIFSNCVFSFKRQYEADPFNIYNNESLMSPTFVLFDESKKFHSFGYDAEYTYDDLASDNKHHKWYFFKRITRILHNKQVTLDVEIEDDKGRKMKAIDVFGAVIKFIKKWLLNLFKTRDTEILSEDIHYVLTAFPLLSNSAKQFMREAAYKAGIECGQLSIVTNPEAASLCCQMLPTDKMHGSKGAKFTVASPGTKFMVVNLNGSKAHITVHERQAGGYLRELHDASGGVLCETNVYCEFYALIIRLIGGIAYQKFVDENKEDNVTLQRAFETKSLTITPQSTGKITVNVPVTLLKAFDDVTNEDIEEAIEGSPYSGKITWSSDKMRIEAQVFKKLFKPCIDKIINHIKELLKARDVEGTNIFLMIGGFSKSVMLQDAIRKALPKGTVIIPDGPDLTVLRGAVIFGHRPVTITSRVSKYTYGIKISPPFDPNIHPEDHRVSAGGIDRCRDVFKKYIPIGETVKVYERRSGVHVSEESNQSEMLLEIFASPKTNPRFVDDDDMEYLGKIVVHLPDCEHKIVHVVMMFGETELIVEAIELSQHTKYRAYFE